MKTITERIDATTEIPPEYRHTIIPAPKSCKIEITSSCNYRCSFCANADMEQKGQMHKDDYRKLVLELKSIGIEELGIFYIGEPFTCSWLEEAIKFAKDAGIQYVFLTTNGSLANPKRVEGCMKAGLDSLKFSLNYASVEQFKEVARVKGKLYGQAIDNIKSAWRIREEGEYKCRLYASTIQFDGEQAERMKEVKDEMRPFLDEMYELPLFKFSDDKVVSQEESLGFKPVAGNPGRAGNRRDSLPCWSGFKEMHIDKDGNLNFCCFGGDKFILGNALETGIMKCWNNLKAQNLRRAHLAKNVSNTVCKFCALA